MGKWLSVALAGAVAVQPVHADGNAGPLAAVETFFNAMAHNDAALAATVVLPDGLLYGYVVATGEPRFVPTPIANYLAAMATREDSLLERIWDARVIADASVAVVWTPYDFYRNGEFHHCGVNSFNLVRSAGSWKIASVVYSMRAEGCEPSPLGPPEFGKHYEGQN